MEDNNLNLKLITNLFEYLRLLKDRYDFKESGMRFNSKEYELIKKKYAFFIKCEDGRCLKIEFKKSNSNLEYEEFYYYTLDAMYSLTNGDILLCTNSNPIKNLDTSIFDNDYEIDYIYTKNNKHHNLTWNQEHKRFNYTYGLKDKSNGYLYVEGTDKYLISHDLNQILTFNNSKLPKKEELEKFNLEEEEEKLNKIINKFDFNEITKNMLIELIDNLEKKKEFISKVINGSEPTIITKCRKIKEEENLINKEVINSIFTKEELTFILISLNKMIKEEYVNKKIIKRK